MSRLIRLLIVVPHDLSRSGLEALVIRPGNGIRVIGALRDFETGEAYILQHRPHILLLDDMLPHNRSVFTVLKDLQTRFPFLKTVILSSKLHENYLHRLFEAGAWGFIYREDRLQESLVVGIETVHQGFHYRSPRASGLFVSQRIGEHETLLSSVDLDVLRQIEQGMTVQEIAVNLELSTRTVYRVRHKLRSTLDVRTNEQLVAAARAQGLLDGTSFNID